MPVLGFVYDAVSRETNYTMWQNLTDTKDNAKRAADNLINKKDKELPELVPDRHLFSWTDGIYNAKTLDFYVYDKAPLPSDVVTIKFFEQSFNPEELFGYHNWYDIPTPDLQNILDYQKLSPDVCKIIYAMMGRCIYEVNELDHWEVIMFIKGIARSGKSTIGKILKDFFPSSDVFVLSSNIEKKFGLAAIYDKLLFLCFEVKANWNLDQGDFQCMISGEEIPIPIKHKLAITTMWKVPGMLMGNEVARSWLDAAGSMTRRILVVEFNRQVKNTDTELGKKLKEHMAAILHKCNMAYHNLIHDCGTASVWDHLPPYFHHTRKNLATLINPLEDFLTNCDLIRIDVDNFNLCIPFGDFQTMYLNYCQRNNYGRVQFREENYGPVFENYGLVIRNEREKEYKGLTKHNIKWIFGVGLREDDSMIDNS
jgi:hypothetical protein